MAKRSRVGVREIRQNLSVYLDRVKAGEAIEITERGTPVAMLVPVPERATVVRRLVADGRATPPSLPWDSLPPPVEIHLDRPLSAILDELREDRLLNGGVAYLDASALVRLIVAEPESVALRAELRRWDEQLTSALSITEVTRACRLAGSRTSPAEAEGLIDRARQLLDRVALLDLDVLLLRAAAIIDPASLRTLDAAHLATALSLGADLGALFTYDKRLAAAAHQHKLEVVSPM